MNGKPARVAIIGPESTGKSTLCSELAAHYNTGWVKEYAREYLAGKSEKYTLADIEEIYRVQYEIENGMLGNAHRMLFTDTEFIIGKVWCEHAFGQNPAYFDAMIREHPYDLYLLTAPDLPWEPDALRENPGKGSFFFSWYERILQELNYKYGIVNGEGPERLKCAIGYVDAFLEEWK